jgi:hypothetical protein
MAHAGSQAIVGRETTILLPAISVLILETDGGK